MPNAVFVLGLAVLPSSDQSGKLFGEILPWLLVLIGVVMAGGVLIMFIRRRLQDSSSSSSPGFTLQDLRNLHARGELTDDEFERAKTQMIGNLKSTTKPKPEADAADPRDAAYRAGKHGPSDQQSSS
jgi:hypothetical protein